MDDLDFDSISINQKKNKKNYNEDSEEEREENNSIKETLRKSQKSIISKKYIKNILDKNKIDNEILSEKEDNFNMETQRYNDEKKETSNIDLKNGKYNIEDLLKKLKDSEKNINERNNIIDNLKKEINEKEKKIKIITKTNNKLQQSLDSFSKKIDDKLFGDNGILEYIKKPKNNIKVNNYDNNDLKQKELDNAMILIKILKNDNQRLQESIDNYEKKNKLKDLESINKIKSEENFDLENQIKILKNELKNYDLIMKKCKIYENQIESLNKENKSIKDNKKLLKDNINQKIIKKSIKYDLNENKGYKGYITPKKLDLFHKNISAIKQNRNKYNLNSDRNNRNINYNSRNNKYINLKINHKNSTINKSIGSLPSINIKNKSLEKNNSSINLNSYKKNYDNKNDILKVFFKEDDIELINKIFKNNSNGLEEFKLKLCIINKSKESLNNKYNIEIKKYNEIIISAQEQIEYLNNKIKETEINCRVLKTQINEFNIEKRILLKKIKMLQENLKEKDNILKLNFEKGIGEEKENKKNEEELNIYSEVEGSSIISSEGINNNFEEKNKEEKDKNNSEKNN